jgi:hypothetical protein
LTEERDDDLEALEIPEDLVAVLVRFDTPVLDLVIDELLDPVDLDIDPMPLLVVDPVVEILGL